jgi:hypothetical protein
MKCGFSETQFAFCYTFEILEKYSALPMPNFLNTVKEGRTGGGYDVQIDKNLFLQFKIPTYSEGKKEYKISIITTDNQYKLLQALKLNCSDNLVYYVAPKFHTCDTMETFYCKKEIESNSVLFSIDKFPTVGKYTQLRYEYKDDKNELFGNLCGRDSNRKHKIEISRRLFSKQDLTDSLSVISLGQKADVLLEIISSVNPRFPSKLEYDEIGSVKRVSSILLNQYNILWIPLKEKA